MPENEPIILYQETLGGHLVGMRIDVVGFASFFKPDPDEQELARIIVWDVIADPSGSGPVNVAGLDEAVSHVASRAPQEGQPLAFESQAA